MVIYGLIGRSLSHSFSATFFNRKFADRHIEAVYKNFELSEITQLEGLLDAHPEINGLNVTIPYKQSVIPLLDDLDPTAASIGAVNTIKVETITGKRRLTGYNTDAPGFLEALLNSADPLPKRALVLGATGGAAAAIKYALHSAGIVTLGVSRHPTADMVAYSDLTPNIIASHHLIVNCTPLGTAPDIHSKPAIPYMAVTPRHIAYDLVYNPPQTAFLHECALRGARTLNGLPMLYAQALLSYNIWTSQSL